MWSVGVRDAPDRGYLGSTPMWASSGERVTLDNGGSGPELIPRHYEAVRVVTMCLGTGLRTKLSKTVALSGVTPCCRCLLDVTLLILASFEDCYEYYFDSVIRYRKHLSQYYLDFCVLLFPRYTPAIGK